MTVTWADTSEYNTGSDGRPQLIDDSYPHPVYSFRTNSGDRRDEVAVEQARKVRALLDSGRLKAALPYYFFRPGQANCDLHRDVLTEAGLWGHPRLVTMVDVEDAGGAITGDQSAEVNDEVTRLREWHGSEKRVVGYLNAVANAALWRTRPEAMPFITPNYSGVPGVWASTPPPAWMRDLAFAQQYTDRGQCAPFPNPVDLNYSSLELADLLALLGIEDGGNAVSDPVSVGAGQLHPFPDKIRQIVHPDNVNSSTKSPAEPWPFDVWADVWNEIVWDGFKLPGAEDDPDAEAHSLVGWTLTAVAEGRARDEVLARIEAKLDQAIGGAK